MLILESFLTVKLNLNLIQTILSQEPSGEKQILDANEQFLISKLYHVQKTVLQQNGYLELEQLNNNSKDIKAILLCNFAFKHN